MDNTTGRYQFVMTQCPATHPCFWGTVLAAADSLKTLWKEVGWRGGLAFDQTFEVWDTKTGRVLTSEEYIQIIEKIQPWM